MNNFTKFIQLHYYRSKPENEKDYSKSRSLFLYEGCAAMGIFTLTSGAFIAGYAKFLGASDTFNGIIGALPALVAAIQIFGAMYFEKVERRKLVISVLALVHRFLFGCMFFIPFLTDNPVMRLVLLAAFYGLAHMIGAFIASAAASWLVDLVPQFLRGKYFAARDASNLAFMTVMNIVLGYVLDVTRKQGNEFSGFLWIAAVVFILMLINFILLSSVKEPLIKTSEERLQLKYILTQPFKEKDFRKVIWLFIFWNVSFQLAAPFFAVYLVSGLQMDYTTIMVVGFIANVFRVIATPFWGKLADKWGWAFTTKVSMGFLGTVHACWFFMDTTTAWWSFPVLSIASGIAWGSIGISLFNIQFVYAPKKDRTMYLSMASALGGIIGFASALISSFFVGIIGSHPIPIFAFTTSSMQWVFLVSGILTVLTAYFVHKRIA
ncbi:MAG: MFS transporter [Hyphomonadaceae bacterium]|nr:MFS transporter [Clostridia bacterium]